MDVTTGTWIIALTGLVFALLSRFVDLAEVPARLAVTDLRFVPIILVSSVLIQRFLERAAGGDPVVVLDAAGIGDSMVEVYSNENFEMTVEAPSSGNLDDDVSRLTTRVLAD